MPRAGKPSEYRLERLNRAFEDFKYEYMKAVDLDKVDPFISFAFMLPFEDGKIIQAQFRTRVIDRVDWDGFFRG